MIFSTSLPTSVLCKGEKIIDHHVHILPQTAQVMSSGYKEKNRNKCEERESK